MSTSTKDKFNLALEELREINDQLFYNELKSNMSEHVSHLEKEYEKVSQKAQEMHEYMGRFEYVFTELTKNVETQLQVTIQNMCDQLPEIFAEHTEALSIAYELFSKIAEDQSTFIQSKDAEWKELADHVKEQQQITLQHIVQELSTLVKEKNDQVIEHREQLTKEVKEQLLDFENQVQKLSEQFDTLLLNFQKEQQKHQLHTETLLQSFINETKEKLQRLEQQINDVEKSIHDSSEEHMLQLVTNQQIRQQKWKEQDDKLVVLQNYQKSQAESMKKWFIGLAISHVIVIASVVGLYLF